MNSTISGFFKLLCARVCVCACVYVFVCVGGGGVTQKVNLLFIKANVCSKRPLEALRLKVNQIVSLTPRINMMSAFHPPPAAVSEDDGHWDVDIVSGRRLGPAQGLSALIDGFDKGVKALQSIVVVRGPASTALLSQS